MTRPAKTEAWRAIVIEQAERLRKALGEKAWNYITKMADEREHE